MKMKNVFLSKIPDSLKKIIKSRNWYRYGIYRDNTLFVDLVFLSINKSDFQKEGINKGINNYIRINDEAYLIEEERKEFVNIMFDKIKKEKDYLNRYMKGHYSDCERLLAFSKKINSKDPKEYNDEELWKTLTDFINLTKPLSHWLWSLAFLNEALDRHLREELVKDGFKESEIDDAISSISAVHKKLDFQKEKEELLKLAAKIKKSRELMKALAGGKDIPGLDRIIKEYSWTSINIWDGLPKTKKEYIKRLRELAGGNPEEEIREIKKEEIIAGKKSAEIIQKIISPYLKSLADIIREMVHLKTFRIDAYSRSFYLFMPFFFEIEKRIGLTHGETMLLRIDEILHLLKGEKIDRAILKKRKESVGIKFNEKIYYFNGNIVKDIRKLILKDYSKIIELKGNSAQPGIVTGKARVILTDREINKVKKDEILIANLTNPNYDSVFSKIKGVVTDEGGVLCHSAIMAREFKIPCIIATKIATRVFKTGDYVEVDADKGIIRKLKK